MFLSGTAVRAIPYMDAQYKANLEQQVRASKTGLDDYLSKNPYGVPVTPGTWGGAGAAVGFAAQMYFLHQAFPDVIGPEYTLRGIDYVLGTHPVSNVSYVSTIGTNSRLVAYGNNRADYTFIPGGIIPGIVIVQPDFPELKPDFPFLWFENEYVVDTRDQLYSGGERDQCGGEVASCALASSKWTLSLHGDSPEIQRP